MSFNTNRQFLFLLQNILKDEKYNNIVTCLHVIVLCKQQYTQPVTVRVMRGNFADVFNILSLALVGWIWERHSDWFGSFERDEGHNADY